MEKLRQMNKLWFAVIQTPCYGNLENAAGPERGHVKEELGCSGERIDKTQ